MKAITYQTDPTVVPIGWAPTANLHKTQTRGFAYEDTTHYVHFYCKERPLWILSPGLTVTESKNAAATLNDWVTMRFGATNVHPVSLDVGEIFDGLWRPGLTDDDDIASALGFTVSDRRAAELPLLLILERLNEMLLYIEPDPSTLGSFGHKQRELLLLSATEAEAQWKWFLVKGGATPAGQGFTTNDYVKLGPALFLSDFDVTILRYPAVNAFSPFAGWSANQPTKSLRWYDAYNATKHDRATGLVRASLEMCLLAVAANLILFVARFGWHALYNGRGNLSANFNETFSIDMARSDPKTFYVPKISIQPNQVLQFVTYNSQNQALAWQTKTLPI